MWNNFFRFLTEFFHLKWVWKKLQKFITTRKLYIEALEICSVVFPKGNLWSEKKNLARSICLYHDHSGPTIFQLHCIVCENFIKIAYSKNSFISKKFTFERKKKIEWTKSSLRPAHKLFSLPLIFLSSRKIWQYHNSRLCSSRHLRLKEKKFRTESVSEPQSLK